MTNSPITEAQPTDEIQELRQRISELEKFLAEREMSEQSLHQQECYFRSLVENSQDGIMVMTNEWIMNYHSHSYARLLGYEPEEVIDNDPFKDVHPDDIPMAVESFSRAMRQPDGISHTELRMRHNDGAWRHIKATITNHINDPAVNGIVANFRDITVHKQAEQVLHQTVELSQDIICFHIYSN